MDRLHFRKFSDSQILRPLGGITAFGIFSHSKTSFSNHRIASDLLYKTWHARRLALLDGGAKPFDVAGSGVGAALAANNAPGNSLQYFESNIRKDRLNAYDPPRCRDLQQQRNPFVRRGLVFAGDAEGDVGGSFPVCPFY